MLKSTKEAVLELESRREVYDLVSRSPGLHFREIQRRLDMAYGKLQYHLEYLVKSKLIEQVKSGNYTRYYVSSFKSSMERDLLSLLRQKPVRNILIFLLGSPCSKNKDICAGLNLSPATVSNHMRKLTRAGVIFHDEKEKCYRIHDPELVSKTLVKYKSSFIDELVERFVEVWENERLFE